MKIENYPPILNEVFSASEAERLWGLAPGTVRAALGRDVIPGRKSGGTWLVARGTMVAHYNEQPPKDIDMKWWIVWQQIEGDEIYAVPFDHEPQNEDIASSSSNGYNMVGYPIRAKNEAEAIKKAEASEEES